MARDGVGEARAQHHEFMLALVLGRANGAANGIVKPAQLALRGRIHVAHAAHDTVRLVVQIKAIDDQFFEFDFGRPFETPVAPALPATVTAIAPAPAVAIVPPPAALTRRPVLTASIWLFFRHLLNPLLYPAQTRPLKRHHSSRPDAKPLAGRGLYIPPHDLIYQMRAQLLKLKIPPRGCSHAAIAALKTVGAPQQPFVIHVSFE